MSVKTERERELLASVGHLGKRSLSQKVLSAGISMEKKGFGPMDRTVKKMSRADRIQQSSEEFGETEKLAEEQRRRYYDDKSLCIEEPGEASRTVVTIEQAKVESAPIETIENPLGFGQGSKKPSVQTSSVNKIVAFLRNPLSYITGRGTK